MSSLRLHPESHLVGGIGWLRVTALGAHDGIVSAASLRQEQAAQRSARHGPGRFHDRRTPRKRLRSPPQRKGPLKGGLITRIAGG